MGYRKFSAGKLFDGYRISEDNNVLITDEEVKAGGYASRRDAALYKGIGFLKHAVDLHPRYVNGYLNLGLAYFKILHPPSVTRTTEALCLK